MNAHARRPRHPHAAAALAVLGLVVLAGCLTADSTMKADGSGTMTLTYPPPAKATKESETKRFTSDVVTVEDMQVPGGGKPATVKLKFTDATKLSTAEGLKIVQVTRTKADDKEKVTIVLKPEKTLKLKPGQGKDEKPLQFKVTMPGKITEATPKGTTEGSTVSWSVPFADFVQAESTTLSLTYELPKAEPPKS